MPKIIFLNGQYLPLKKAGISPLDLGLIRGYAVFDVMKIVNGKPFLSDAHWKRLKNSARILGLRARISDRKYKEVLEKLIKKNKVKKGHIIRTIITGGISPDGMTPQGRVTFYITVEKLKPLPHSAYEKGVKVITHEYQREYPQSKVTNYVTAIKNIKRKIKEGAHEVIYVSNRIAKEGALSNYFMVKKEKVLTPKEKILIGITRNLVIKLARKAGYKIIERDIRIDELHNADEIFLTNTTKGILPVVKVDDKKIGSEKAGKITEILMKRFSEFVKNY